MTCIWQLCVLIKPPLCLQVLPKHIKVDEVHAHTPSLALVAWPSDSAPLIIRICLHLDTKERNSPPTCHIPRKPCPVCKSLKVMV
jgi:hypothetical protein